MKGDPGIRRDVKTGKMRLNEFLAKYCPNPSQRDLDFDTTQAPGPSGMQLFVSTLLLKNLGGRPGEGMAFAGDQKPNKQDAEHSASDAALRYLTTLPGAPMIAVPPPEPPSPTPTPAPSAAGAASALATVEKFTNPKGTLQEIVLKKMRRQTPDDLCYQPTPVDNGYIIRLRVGAHVVGGEALTIDSRPFPIKTKKSVKEAEEEVASMALQRLNVGSAVPAAPPKTLVEALTKPAEAPAAAAMSNQEVGFGASTHSSDGRADTEQDVKEEVQPEEQDDGTVKVCLVRPDGKEKCMILPKSMQISELILKHRPSCLGEEEVEVVGPGDMVLLPEFTLLDCTMVFDTSEEVPKFMFREAED